MSTAESVFVEASLDAPGGITPPACVNTSDDCRGTHAKFLQCPKRSFALQTGGHGDGEGNYGGDLLEDANRLSGAREPAGCRTASCTDTSVQLTRRSEGRHDNRTAASHPEWVSERICSRFRTSDRAVSCVLRQSFNTSCCCRTTERRSERLP